uniref:BTB/POZ domain-containing protein n=1 Tax=Hucho hucho TaxID=62062 RepID=A0A4W5RNJ8_9TELE
MKPDGVATAAMEPMEELDADPVNEPVAMGEEPNQAAPAPQTEGVADPKAKTKAPAAKTKPGTTATIKTTTGPGSRPNTAQSRLTNGVSKPHANGVAKKTTTGAPEKAMPKRPVGTAVSPTIKTTTKVGEKKPAGTTRPTSAPAATNGVKATTGTAAKKTPAVPTNGVKATTTTAKKPTATGAPGSRPASAAARPATASTAKSSTSTAKPGTPTAKTTSTTPRPASAKAGSTTPSAGRTPTSQPSKTATPVKKDVTKSATKKPAAAPLTRTSPAKTTKLETPKSASASKPDSTPKKLAASSKAADTKKTPSKPTPSKDVSAGPKTPSTKPAVKASTPKKTVGSNTPMAVKRGPKPTTAADPATKAGETLDAAAAIAAAALAAVVSMASSEEAVVAAVPEEETVPPQASQPEEAPEAFISQLSAQLDLVHLEEPADTVSPLGTTVMSPPCSPTGPMSPVREPQNPSALLDMHVQPEPRSQNQSAMAPQSPVQEEVIFQPDPWAQNQSAMSPQSPVQEEVIFQPDPWAQNQSAMSPQIPVQEEVKIQPDEQQEDLLMPSSSAPPAFSMMSQPMDEFTSEVLVSPYQDQEEAVEKADEEINEDDDDEEEEEERMAGKPTSLFDMSFRGATGWHGDDVLSGMDSEDVSSRLQGSSEISSTQHTGLLQGTQSSDALVDSGLKGSEGEGAFMCSPDVETLPEEERVDVDDMDVSSERAVDHLNVCQQEDEEDDDVEMHSEGVTESGLESCGNADEDDYTEEDRLDNLNRSPIPPSSAWGQTNPFTDPWAQPPLSSPHTASSPLSDHGAADPETPTQSSAQAWLDLSAPSLTLHSEQPSEPQSVPEEMESSAPVEASAPPGPPAVGMSQSSTLSGTGLAVHSSSETSTPEELRDYDSSSGVESRSDKQQTPVPSNVQPDLEQDLGIHLERGDEEEEAETLPADEVLGAGPPTAPASAPSSPSTSGDEASDTEDEIQINDPDVRVTMDDSAEFDSPPSARILPALEEDEEVVVVEAPAGEGEEDGGGGTPQSANSVASYGFDCTMSNSNAHSTAESCGKSPGIFSLENEDQLPEEAKDPILIKELTLPAAAAQSEELLGGPVDLLPLGQPGDQHHYMLGGKMDADDLEEANTLEDALRLGPQRAGEASEGQPPYYSAICDKTDSFLAGNDHIQLPPHLVVNGHYLAEQQSNRRPTDTTSRFLQSAAVANGQLSRLEQHQKHLRERQQQERQKRQWLEEECLRQEQQMQLERQRRELLQLQLQQQQQEHRHRRQVLQWQLELEQQLKQQLRQQQKQQQQQQLRSPSAVMLSPSSRLCTIYEAMETSEEEDEESLQQGPRPIPPTDLDWSKKVDIVQQLINQTLLLSGDRGCPPLLLLPVGSGGTLSPLESSMWPNLLPPLSPTSATVTSVSSYSPDSQGSSPQGDWTVVELETQH